MDPGDVLRIWITPASQLQATMTPAIRRAYFVQGSVAVSVFLIFNILAGAPWLLWGLWAFITYHFLKVTFLTKSVEDIVAKIEENNIERRYQKAKRELEDFDDITKQS